jgi:hypothetical protein
MTNTRHPVGLGQARPGTDAGAIIAIGVGDRGAALVIEAGAATLRVDHHSKLLLALVVARTPERHADQPAGEVMSSDPSHASRTTGTGGRRTIL